MLEGFQNLASEELDALIATPLWITILLGGADGKIDGEERDWSERLVYAHTYAKPHVLNPYYAIVVHDFLGKLDRTLTELPTDPAARNEALAYKIGAVNPILQKLDTRLGAALYKSFVGLAAETAKASGGFLRIGAVSAAEQQWVKLPMLAPILPPKAAGNEAPVDEDEETTPEEAK